jgi:hypothetical protein
MRQTKQEAEEVESEMAVENGVLCQACFQKDTVQLQRTACEVECLILCQLHRPMNAAHTVIIHGHAREVNFSGVVLHLPQYTMFCRCASTASQSGNHSAT